MKFVSYEISNQTNKPEVGKTVTSFFADKGQTEGRKQTRKQNKTKNINLISPKSVQ